MTLLSELLRQTLRQSPQCVSPGLGHASEDVASNTRRGSSEDQARRLCSLVTTGVEKANTPSMFACVKAAMSSGMVSQRGILDAVYSVVEGEADGLSLTVGVYLDEDGIDIRVAIQ